MALLVSVFPPLPFLRRSSPTIVRQKGKQQQHQRQPKPSAPAVSRIVDSLLYLRDGLDHREREEKRFREERRQILNARMLNAESFKQWDVAAHELDLLEGNEAWKADTSTGDYNPDLLELRLRELDRARASCDVRAMLYLVRTALSRDLGGMGNLDLYRHSYCGTKKLIERYVDSALQTITALVERGPQNLPGELSPKDLLEGVLYARQSFGRSALLLSGGGTFGMTHIGVMKALFAAKLLPRIISGASAGSIVCSVVCARTDDEIPTLLEEFPYGDLAVFEEEGNEDGLLDHLRRLLTEGNWSDIKHLTRVMRDLLGDITFQEAYNRTRRICNICVSTASIYEMPRLLNYVTAPNVMIWSAVAASCSVPLVFSAAPLLVKSPLTGEHTPWNPTPQMWIDGSVDNDLPMTRLAEMFNVNHFIVSQVNPHVVPFLAKDDTPSPSCVASHQTVYREESDWVRTMTALAKSEALHRMQFMAEIGVFPNLVSKLRSILSQKYSGDINILPAVGMLDLPKILKNPTTDFMVRSCLLGERATWPKLSRIRDRCAIELALDRAVHALRARVVFSKSQVDLRRLATGSLANAHRGSEEPLISMPVRVETASAKEKLRHRQRRLSVGNILNPHHTHVAHDSPHKLTDDETDEEERLEMTMRRPSGKAKMKLKRIPKPYLFNNGPKSSPAVSSTEAETFDFSRPRTPARATDASPTDAPPTDKCMSPSTLSAVQTADMDAMLAAETASMTSPPSAAKMETSDLHSSDADVESHTDDEAADTAFQSPCASAGQDLNRPVLENGIESSGRKEDMFSLARHERSRPKSMDAGGSGPATWEFNTKHAFMP